MKSMNLSSKIVEKVRRPSGSKDIFQVVILMRDGVRRDVISVFCIISLRAL